VRDLFSPLFLLSLAVLALMPERGVDPSLPRALLLPFFVLAVLAFFFRRHALAYALLAFSFALLLAGGFLERRERYETAASLSVPTGEYVTVTGVLLDYPRIGDGESDLLLRADHVEFGNSRRPFNRTLRVRVAGDCRELNRGDSLRAALVVDERDPAVNFTDPPLAARSLVDGVHGYARCKSPALIERLHSAPPAWRLLGAWRAAIRTAIERRWRHGPNGAGKLALPGVFMEATVLGDRGRLDGDSREELVGAGVYHLLAISGANIAMVALFSLGLLGALRLRRRVRYLATAALLVLFLAVSGFDVSAARAVLMALLLFAARLLYADIEPLNIVSVCGLALLVINPAYVLDPGFVLTFTLTAAIVRGRTVLAPLLKRWQPAVREFVSANLSAFFVSWPLSLFYFRRFAPAGFLAGLLLIPLTGAVSAAAALLLVLAPVSTQLCQPLLILCDLPLRLFFLVGEQADALGNGGVWRPAPTPLLMAALLAAGWLLTRRNLKPFRRVAAALALALLLGLTLQERHRRPARFELTALDVGHGDSLVALFPGGDALLVDGGGSRTSAFSTGRRIVQPFLVERGIRVRWLALSHPDADHLNGLVEIARWLDPDELWLGPQGPRDPPLERLLASLPRKMKVVPVRRGFSRTISGVAVSCFSPGPEMPVWASANDRSLVLRLDDGWNSFLLTGDIGAAVEQQLVARFGPALRSGVLKLAHHGSAGSSTPGFLAEVNPGLVIISSAAGESFPHPRVLRDLRRLRLPRLQTGKHGGIQLTSLPGGLRIEVSK
jgi:competence protein ComEC